MKAVIVIAFIALTCMAASARGAESQCPNEAFRSGPGASLPDCRAYEQVSPPNKNGGFVQGFPGFLLASEDGSRATFYSQNGSGIPATGGSTQDYATYLSTLAGETWSVQRLLPPQSLGQKAGFLGATPDLRYAIVEAEQLGYEAPGFGRGLYEINTINQSVLQIVPREDNEFETPYAFDGASVDGSRVFFETTAPIKVSGPEPEPGKDNLYVWNRQTGAVSLAGVLPGVGQLAPEGGSFGGAYEWFEETNTEQGGALKGLAVGAVHAVSPNGSQVYFTAGESGQLYLRQGLETSEPTTIAVSAPNTGVVDSAGPKPAAFQEATPDGSRAFFLSGAKLTGNASTGSNDEGSDLYRFDISAPAGERVVDITPDTNSETPNGAEVLGLLGVSDDGSSGYFVAHGMLASGAQPGAENIYRFSEQAGITKVTFVAALLSREQRSSAPLDEFNWSPRAYANSTTVINEKRNKTSRVSSDGNVLLFSSRGNITGYEPTSSTCAPSEAPLGGFRCAELYRYSAVTNTTKCVSCDPGGENPIGAATLQSSFVNGFFTPINGPAVALTRNLSSNGNRVFFQSPDPLVAADSNGASGCAVQNIATNTGFECQDVYQWEAAEGVAVPGGCTTQSVSYVPASEGCLSLLSTGLSNSASYFLDASSDGSSAFIITASSLVPVDGDQGDDAYDARSLGGLASQQTAERPRCSGEACLASPVPRPEAATPASSEVRDSVHRHRKHKHRHYQKKRKNHHARRKNSKKARHADDVAGSNNRKGVK